VGITYKGTSAALNGCVNDVKNLYGFVQRFYGFRREDCRVLTDDPTFTGMCMCVCVCLCVCVCVCVCVYEIDG
jgi:hypothetical protein